MTDAFNEIPKELQLLKHWFFTLPDSKAPHSLIDGRAVAASINNSASYMAFEDAVAAARQLGGHPYFVLTERDPYTVIDMDVKTAQTHPNEPEVWTTPETQAWQYEAAKSARSYTERSRSGLGLHVWVRANIGTGYRERAGRLEIYSQKRGIICTGNRLKDLPATIDDRQDAILNFIEAGRKERGGLTLVQLPDSEPEPCTDAEVLERIGAWVNAAKFNKLWAGNWKSVEDVTYASQSEADEALMSFLWKVTKNIEQVFRLFRKSPMAQTNTKDGTRRKKVLDGDYYLRRTLQDLASREAEERADVERLMQQGWIPAGVTTPDDDEFEKVARGEFRIPPGTAGHLARMFYKDSYFPVPEVSVAAALGLLAGLCGRNNLTPTGTDTALYLILVARSGIGKNEIHDAIPKALKGSGVKMAMSAIEETAFASGQALHLTLSTTQGFLNLQGEIGHLFRRMANPKDEHARTFRDVLTNCYAKRTLPGKRYAESGKDYLPVDRPGLSLLGETTPGAFRECLTDSMMEDGFMSRFTVIEYKGDVPDKNRHRVYECPPEIWEYFRALVHFEINMRSPQGGTALSVQPVQVTFSEEARKLSDTFEEKTILSRRGVESEYVRQVWNRAHLKALKIASLLAAADRYWQPVISGEHMEWAIWLVERDIALFLSHLKKGEVGTDDQAREQKLLSVMRDYVKVCPKSISPEMHKLHIIPRRFLQQKIANVAAFKNHPRGASSVFTEAIKSLRASGYLVPADVKKEFKFNGEAYLIDSSVMK